MTEIAKYASNLITDFYLREEAWEELQSAPDFEVLNHKMSLVAGVDTVFMLDAIASRFSITRVDLVRPMLELYAKELFSSLNQYDRESIAKKVDSLVTETLPEGETFTICNAAGSFENEFCDWRGLHALLNKVAKS